MESRPSSASCSEAMLTNLCLFSSTWFACMNNSLQVRSEKKQIHFIVVLLIVEGTAVNDPDLIFPQLKLCHSEVTFPWFCLRMIQKMCGDGKSIMLLLPPPHFNIELISNRSEQKQVGKHTIIIYMVIKVMHKVYNF